MLRTYGPANFTIDMIDVASECLGLQNGIIITAIRQ